MILPMQYFGLGDVIFEQTLVRAFNEPVLWGVQSNFIEGLQRAYPDITFIDTRLLNIDWNRKSEYEISGAKVLPLRWADQMLGLPYLQCMAAKYLLYGMAWEGWKDQAMWIRDTKKEMELSVLLASRHNINGQYNLVNTTFGSDSQLQIPIIVNNGLPTIHMRTIDGFSLFDWAYIIEHAATIHTVSTSIIYLLELLKLKASEIHLYPRKPHEQDFRNVDYLLTSHEYIKHG